MSWEVYGCVRTRGHFGSSNAVQLWRACRVCEAGMQDVVGHDLLVGRARRADVG